MFVQAEETNVLTFTFCPMQKVENLKRLCLVE